MCCLNVQFVKILSLKWNVKFCKENIESVWHMNWSAFWERKHSGCNFCSLTQKYWNIWKIAKIIRFLRCAFFLTFSEIVFYIWGWPKLHSLLICLLASDKYKEVYFSFYESEIPTISDVTSYLAFYPLFLHFPDSAWH